VREEWKKLFSLEKTRRHNNGLQVVFVERTCKLFPMYVENKGSN